MAKGSSLSENGKHNVNCLGKTMQGRFGVAGGRVNAEA